jgi:myo-inositol-1(or 4)-monophosphatase
MAFAAGNRAADFSKILRVSGSGVDRAACLEIADGKVLQKMTAQGAASFVAFAGRLADAARRVTLGAAAGMRSVEDKGRNGRFDPVTAADREAERVMRSLIEAQYPDHGIDGEEYPPKVSGGRYRWSLDPIDGTRAFICGLPSWTTLIALLEDASPLVGIIDAPMVGERYIGAGGTTKLAAAGGTRPLMASGCTSLSDARLATTDPFLFEGEDASRFERVRRAVRLARYGYDAYGYARLAAGGIDLVVENGLQPHDIGALVPVVRGAGGVIGNWRGGDDLVLGDIIAAASQPLYDEAVRCLARA